MQATSIHTRSTTTAGTTTAGRFVDPQDLMCAGCGERPIRCAPPAYWKVRDGLPVPQFSHHDATALCRTAAGSVAEPVEAAR